MPTSLIVVDDFLERPEAFRERALRLTYPAQQGAFPGRNSLERIDLPGLSEYVSQLTGERLKPMEPLGSHGKCRITLASDVGLGRVHVDPGYWSGILYLSLPEHCSGGTDFFRHRRTNTDRRPMTAEEVAALGYASFDEAHRDIIERDGLEESAWEKTMTVPMRFNRLVLLRPWLWHTAGPGFGDNLANGRLIHVLFFAPAAGAA
ncbi:hypothetical protein GCM10028794_19740 [Silanimonas algicola]